MRRFRLVSLLLAFALIATACGSNSDENATDPAETEAPDTAEGPEPEVEDEVVVLCSLQEEWCEAAVPAFAEATGIDASFVRLSAGEAITRLEAEGDNPTFDVWFGGPSLGPATAMSRGFIEPYVSENASVIDDSMKADDGTWTGIYLGALGFCSNTDFLDELGVDVPVSYDDLLNPALVSNIAMADQRTSGTAATAAANLTALLGSEDAALDYLKKLDSNIFQYTRSGSAPGRMAAAGEVAVAIIFSHDCVQFQLETGAPIVVSFPAEGTGFEVGQVSLIANASHPGAARAFVDWALTPTAQELAATVNAFQIPSHPEAAVPEQAVSLEEVVLAPGYSPQLSEDLRGGDFPERFANEVREGTDAPE